MVQLCHVASEIVLPVLFRDVELSKGAVCGVMSVMVRLVQSSMGTFLMVLPVSQCCIKCWSAKSGVGVFRQSWPCAFSLVTCCLASLVASGRPWARSALASRVKSSPASRGPASLVLFGQGESG